MHNRSYPSPRGKTHLRMGGNPEGTEMMWERGGVVFSSPGEQNWKGRVISALPSPGKVYMVAKLFAQIDV